MDSTMTLTELYDVPPIIAAIRHYDNEVTLDTQRGLGNTTTICRLGKKFPTNQC